MVHPLFTPAGVTFEAIGGLLIATMLMQLARIFSWRYVRTWAWGAAAAGVSLTLLRLSVAFPSAVLLVLVLVAQSLAMLALFAGCRDFVTGISIERRTVTWFAAAAVAAGAVFVFATGRDADDAMCAQSVIMTAGALLAFLPLGRVVPARRTIAWETLRLALVTFGAVSAVAVPLFFVNAHMGEVHLVTYSSFVRVLVSAFLAFAMVLVAAEDANRELKEALEDLEEARSRVEQKLHTDPLTEALSRHAFHWMQRGDEIATEGVLSGVVVMIDIDSLKQINDERGHAAGDVAIRSVANAIRGIIRADDLLFRWGGDEFLLIVPNLTLTIVASRMESLSEGISVRAEFLNEFRCHISWGGAEFGTQQSLEKAVSVADAAMYRRRELERGPAE